MESSSTKGVKFSCDQCDYKATRKGSLKTHIQSVHEKVRYSCNQCDHQASTHTGKSEE